MHPNLQRVDGGSGPRYARTRMQGDTTNAANLDIASLYRRYGSMVRGRCRSLLRNDADAQEVTQEVFLKLHRYQDSWRGDAAPTTYLFKITTTTCLNWLRTRKRRREEIMDEVPEPAPRTTSLLDALATAQLVDLLLDGVDEGVAAAVIYFYIDGLTHEEAGELLGVSAAAVRKRVATFRNHVRNAPPSWMEDR
jgi:RNA polymerase sigma-70 factor, ECF subfamily